MRLSRARFALVSAFAVFALSLALARTPSLAHAAIHEYKNVVVPRDMLLYRKSGMFALGEAPEGEASPLIKLDLAFDRVNPEFHGEAVGMQVVVMDETTWNTKLGLVVKDKDGKDEHVYCCHAELKKAGLCEREGALILREDPDSGTRVYDVTFPVADGGDAGAQRTATAPFRASVPITSTGMKYVVFAACNELTGPVSINGWSAWRNPYGYLPGELYGLLPFFAKMAGVYLFIAVLWMVLSLRHWRELMLLQTFSTAVLGLGMMEMAVRYFDFATFNREGSRATELMVLSSLFHTTKQTVSRVLVLLIAMGFGVIKPALEDSTRRAVTVLAVAYFFFAALQRLYELLSHTAPLSIAQYFATLPVAALDLVFGAWIFYSINVVINTLADKEGNVHKLSLFRSFRIILGLTLLVAFFWSLAYVYFIVSGHVSTDWQNRWMYDAVFDVLYLAVLVAILLLFRPAGNSSTYAYQEVATWINSAVATAGGARHPKRTEAEAAEYGAGLEEEEKTKLVPGKSANDVVPV